MDSCPFIQNNILLQPRTSHSVLYVNLLLYLIIKKGLFLYRRIPIISVLRKQFQRMFPIFYADTLLRRGVRRKGDLILTVLCNIINIQAVVPYLFFPGNLTLSACVWVRRN